MKQDTTNKTSWAKILGMDMEKLEGEIANLDKAIARMKKNAKNTEKSIKRGARRSSGRFRL